MMSEDRDRNNRRSDRGSRFDDGGPRERSRSRDRGGPGGKNTRRIYVSNIPYEFRWQDLKDLFRREVGDVSFVELFTDENNKPRGCGIVEFDKPDCVEKCLEKMNRYEINGRNLVVKEDYGNERDKYGRVVPKRIDGPGGGMNNSFRGGRDRDDDRMGGGHFDERQFETYGLSVKFLEGLGIQGPLHTKVFVANMDYKVDAKKLKQVFKMAGKVVSVDLATDKDGASRGFAVVEYEHPVEAVQAISMFDRQQLYERRMTVRLDRVPDKNEGVKLPEGLKGIGLGLGPNGEPLRDVARNLPSLQSNNGPGNQVPAPVAPPITNAASLLGQPNLASNLAALSALSGVSALSNLSSAAGLTGLGLGGALNNASDSNPAFSTSAAYNTNSSVPNRSSNDFDLGVRSYSTQDDFRGGFGNGRDNSRQSDTIIIRNLPASWTWQNLRDKFRDVGEVKFAEIRGEAGVVRFSSNRDAEVAIKLMNGSRFDGRLVDIDYF
ncbi:myelin expression factor 2 [Culicoides brevitarsis]|uniref:myelin expression factor 2 n=1 Tax=Culicoides brevitarsis TaxID=469753 RepID=UPI00307B5041